MSSVPGASVVIANSNGSSGSNAAVVAALAAILVAFLGTVYQAVYAHNENRRRSHWDAVESLAGLLAAANEVLSAARRPPGIEPARTPEPGRAPIAGTAAATGQTGPDTGKVLDAGRAMAEFERNYVKLALVAGGLQPQLSELRTVVRQGGGLEAPDPHRPGVGASPEVELERLTGELLAAAQDQLTPPFLAWLPRHRQ